MRTLVMKEAMCARERAARSLSDGLCGCAEVVAAVPLDLSRSIERPGR